MIYYCFKNKLFIDFCALIKRFSHFTSSVYSFLGSISNSSYRPQDSVNRYKIFRSGSGYCHGKFSKDICIFGLGDLPGLHREVTTGLSLFANKFHVDYQPVTYDCLEELMNNRTRTNSSVINSDAYRKLSFVQDYIREH